MIHMKGLGSARCIEVTPAGRPCNHYEVEGLEFCLQHMPESLLAEAEQVTGVLRCHKHPDGWSACRELAQTGTDHCPAHNPAKRARVQLAVIQGEAVAKAQTIIAERHDDLEHASPVADPYGELMDVAGELRAWKDILRGMVVALERTYRYKGDYGEQTRAEVILYNQALKDFAQVLLAIGRLNLDARLVGIRQQSVEMLDRALDLALEKAGVSYADKDKARATFREHIRVVA